jgi:predicted transglutaminase-like cysteine proteinase
MSEEQKQPEVKINETVNTSVVNSVNSDYIYGKNESWGRLGEVK